MFGKKRLFTQLPQIVRYTTPEENCALTTFPLDFKWPPRVNKKQKCKGYGNAIPPLFAQKLFRAASVNA